MPHVSKHKVSEDVLKDIFRQFSKSVKRGNSSFMTQFFTQTEQIMFAKRLAIILMLGRGISPYHIVQMLKVSPSTVGRISARLERGAYNEVSVIIKDSEDSILRAVKKLLDMVKLPPRGRGRWAKTFELLK